MEVYPEKLSRIKEILRKQPRGMNITDIARELDVYRSSAAKYLDMLLMSGQVEMQSFGPVKVYTLSQRVPISAMLNFSSDCMVVLDERLVVVQVNDNLRSLFEVKQDEMLDAKVGDILPVFDSPEMKNRLREALEGEEITLEQAICIQESELHFKLKLIPTVFENGGSGVTIIMEDITERRLAEKKIRQQNKLLNTVLEALAHPFYVIDVNDYTIKLTNSVTHGGTLPENMTCHVLTHHSDTPCEEPEHCCPVREVKRTKKPATTEHIHYDKKGNARVFKLHAYPIFDEEGNVVQVIESNIDITEQKDMEKVLRETKEKYQLLSEDSSS